jgi:arginyl-tRNA synthetase
VATNVIRDDLQRAVHEALERCGLPLPPGGVEVDPARQRQHGDFQTNAALKLAKGVGRNPRDVAADLAAALEAGDVAHLERVEVAGPGFVNLHLRPSWLHETGRQVVVAGERWGRGDALAGRRINVEFVSANPTGPLHAGGGRWAAVGDALANLLASQGADVHREYYLNDTGTQMATFTASLMARYHGEKPDKDGYVGQYVVDMAARMRAELGDGVTPEQAEAWGYADVLVQLRDDLGRLGVHFDTWSSERVLHERGEVQRAIDDLAAAGALYEEEGATWFRAEDFGADRNRVIVKSDGLPTYLAADVAYHRDKLARGHQHLIDIWGADHHGQVASLQGAMAALGHGAAGKGAPPAGEPGGPEPEIILGQLVTLVKAGQVVRISKRTGNVITVADILDEVDPDVARLTFLLQGVDTTQTFDIDVVTAQSSENPVYYVQYAHARIASIGRRAAERGIERAPLDTVDLSVLTHDRELDLLRTLETLPATLAEAAALRAPHRVTTWARELAGQYHGFQHDCRVLPSADHPIDPGLTQARLWLTEMCRIGLVAALGVLGVSAPDRMDRDDPEDDAA